MVFHELLGRLLLAAILGGIVGLDRENKNWVAGLRTHMLVALGSCFAMIISKYAFQDVVSTQKVILDPSRMAAAVISGIGFLGAGTIIFYKNQYIKGLTTAAGLWAIAIIGLGVGSGFYLLSIACTLLTLLVLVLIKYVENKAKLKINIFKLVVKTATSKPANMEIAQLLENYGAVIEESSVEKKEAYCNFEYLLTVKQPPEKLLADIERIPSVNYVGYMIIKD